MTNMEIDLDLPTMMSKLNEVLDQRFEKMDVEGIRYYKLPDRQIITITAITEWRGIVVEYAENEKEAEMNWFEDGDVFYLADYEDVESYIKAIMGEIEGNMAK